MPDPQKAPTVPAGWTEVPLGEVADVVFSNVDKKSWFSEPSVSLCNYLDVYENDYLGDDHHYMEATASRAEIKKFGLRPGDVLITKDSETPDDIGVPAVIDSVVGTLVCGYHLALIRPGANANPVFLAKQIGHERIQRYFGKEANGITRYGLATASVTGLRLLLPPIREQNWIAMVLRNLDDAIRRTEQVVAKLRQMKQGLIHDLLTRGVDDHGELRPLREEAPHLYKDSPLGPIPISWKTCRTLDVASSEAGSTAIGPFGSNLKADDYRSAGVPVVFVRDVRESGFEWNSSVYISTAKAKSLSVHGVRPGDVLATKMGVPPCISTIYPQWMPSGIITADVVRLRANRELARPEWISMYLNCEAVRSQVRAIMGGVTRSKITLADFRGLSIAVPPPSEQDRIQRLVRNQDARLASGGRTGDKLRALRRGLLHDLVTGRVRGPMSEPVAG